MSAGVARIKAIIPSPIKARLRLWVGNRLAARIERDKIRILSFLGGIGDDLLVGTVAHELRRRSQTPVWVVSEFAPLFERNSDVQRVISAFDYYRWLRPVEPQLTKVGLFKRITYQSDYDPATDTSTIPTEHIIAELCRHAGISGTIALRPRLRLSESEIASAKEFQGCLVVQSSGMAAKHPMLTKEWIPERFEALSARLLATHNVVQVGHARDPHIPCSRDLRGKTSLRQLAAILHNARLFVGQVGMMMHLARAVDCPSVIIYGGRERPDQSGYGCNANLYRSVHCSPCWKYRCDENMICMREISVDDVTRAVEEMLSRNRDSLSVDKVAL